MKCAKTVGQYFTRGYAAVSPLTSLLVFASSQTAGLHASSRRVAPREINTKWTNLKPWEHRNTGTVYLSAHLASPELQVYVLSRGWNPDISPE